MWHMRDNVRYPSGILREERKYDGPYYRIRSVADIDVVDVHDPTVPIVLFGHITSDVNAQSVVSVVDTMRVERHITNPIIFVSTNPSPHHTQTKQDFLDAGGDVFLDADDAAPGSDQSHDMWRLLHAHLIRLRTQALERRDVVEQYPNGITHNPRTCVVTVNGTPVIFKGGEYKLLRAFLYATRERHGGPVPVDLLARVLYGSGSSEIDTLDLARRVRALMSHVNGRISTHGITISGVEHRRVGYVLIPEVSRAIWDALATPAMQKGVIQEE